MVLSFVGLLVACGSKGGKGSESGTSSYSSTSITSESQQQSSTSAPVESSEASSAQESSAEASSAEESTQELSSAEESTEETSSAAPESSEASSAEESSEELSSEEESSEEQQSSESSIASDTSSEEPVSSSSAEGGDYVVTDSPYDLLNGRKAKRTYSTLVMSGIASLNYLQTSAQANATHFANFVDGILTHNEFGVLNLNLAEGASHNRDYTAFTFKIRDDDALCWTRYDGTKYTHYEDGEDKVQKIKAADFVAGAMYVCNYKTASDTAYLVTDFIRGAAEYYYYTQILDGIGQGIAKFVRLNTDAKKAKYINDTMKAEKENIVKLDSYVELTADDIPNVANGKRFGIVADEEENTVTYYLYSGAFYFPTLLTYSCYLPVNQYFLTEKGSSFGTSSRDSILYCGPYRIDHMDETSLIYKKNEVYAQRADIQGYMQARAETIVYNIINGEISSDYTRNQFEAGNIDGFGLSMSDTEGWKKYITGPDRDPQTRDEELECLENPYDGNVNSRLLDTIGSMYGSNLVLERSSNDGIKSYSNLGTADTVKNTEKALRLSDVRAAIMGAFDYPTYYARHADGNSDSVLASQYLVNTYVPKNFVYDDNGNEYVDAYYTAEFARQNGMPEGSEASGENGHYDEGGNWKPDEGTAAHYLATGQYDERHKSKAEVATLVDKAIKAVELYNASEYGAGANAITLPIQVEYYSMWDGDQESKAYDIQMVNSMNIRLNKLTEPVASDYSNCTLFKVVPTDKVTSANYNECSGSSDGAANFDFSPVLWGWGADYGDPLTFLATYKKGGDWKSIFPWIDDEEVKNYTTTGEGDNTVLNAPVDLLAEYGSLVDAGAAETENLTNRYTYFAEAEYKLINELHFYEPQVNYGQGWSLSISKSAGYEVPTSNYGLSNERLTGMWVLETPLTREERKEIRLQYNEAKKEYTAEHGAYDFYTD